VYGAYRRKKDEFELSNCISTIREKSIEGGRGGNYQEGKKRVVSERRE